MPAGRSHHLSATFWGKQQMQYVKFIWLSIFYSSNLLYNYVDMQIFVSLDSWRWLKPRTLKPQRVVRELERKNVWWGEHSPHRSIISIHRSRNHRSRNHEEAYLHVRVMVYVYIHITIRFYLIYCSSPVCSL